MSNTTIENFLVVGEYKGDNMTTYINDEIIEKVKDSSDIVEIVSDYVPLKKAGANYVGLCPFHNEKTPSFTVSETKQFFHCFGCGEGGDAITFVMKKENLEFIDAIKLLANKYGIEIEEKNLDQKYINEKERAYEINREAARWFYKNLTMDRQALEYLRRRQISPKLINQFGLGYSPNSWNALYNHLTNKGYEEKEIAKIGLIAPKSGNNGYYDRFRNRIMFPIIDTKSRVIGFGGRVMDHHMPKYLNSKESIIFDKGNYLYGLNLVSKYSNREKILLVEGYMDVIALFSKGINYAVASLGTSLTERQSRLLKRYGKEIYICYDSDAAGVKATLRAIDMLLNEDVEPRIIMLPKGMDPDDYINKVGLLEFDKLFIKSYNYIDYKIYIIKNKYDLNDVEDKIKFTVEVANIIKSLKSPVEQDVYIKKTAETTGISIGAIEDEIRRKSGRNKPRFRSNSIENKRPEISPVKHKITSGNLKAEFNLIRLMIEDRDYFEFISSKLSFDDFSSRECREIFKYIKEEFSTSDFLKIEDIRNKAKINNIDTELFNSIIEMEIKYEPTNIEEIMKDLINTVIYKNLENKRQDILKKIETIEKKMEKSQEEYDNFKNLCLELTRLNNEIKLIRQE